MVSSPSREGHGLAANYQYTLLSGFTIGLDLPGVATLCLFFFSVAFEIGDMGELTHPLSED